MKKGKTMERYILKAYNPSNYRVLTETFRTQETASNYADYLASLDYRDITITKW